MRKAFLWLLALLLAGCLNPASLSPGHAVLRLQPRFEEGGYGTQAVVSRWTKASINHLVVKVFTLDGGEVPVLRDGVPLTRDIRSFQLDNVQLFTNLRADTTYRIRSYAYKAEGMDPNDLISNETSFVDVPVTDDDRPTMAGLPVRLIDKPFSGQATGSLNVTDGGFIDVASISSSISRPNFLISTLAGTGVNSFSGDGGPAIAATLNEPQGIAIAPSGNIYLADYFNHCIRKISNGIITTVAGTPTATGSSGDGGPATEAKLWEPRGISLDGDENLYIADVSNHKIRKVTRSTGIITTVAGTGTGGYNGDGIPATEAQLHLPIRSVVDASGNLFIADHVNSRIRKVSGGIISTVAGCGLNGYAGDGGPATEARLHGPIGITVDASGNLYFAEFYNHTIRKVSGGIITTVAGNGTNGFSGDGGAATAAQLNNPSGVAVDAQGNLFISDLNNCRIRRVTRSTGIVDTVAGNGEVAFSGDGGPAASAAIHGPWDIAIDSLGNLFFLAVQRVRVLY